MLVAASSIVFCYTGVVQCASCADYIHAQGKSSALLSTLLLARSGLGATRSA